MVIGLRKPKRLSKGSWECRIGMGRGCLREGNGPRMPKKDEMGQGSLEAMEWAKEEQNSMNTSLMVILGHWN